LTLVMIVVSDVVSLKERGKYQGILGGVVATANSIGPVLGGVFTEKASCESQSDVSLRIRADLSNPQGVGVS
jgi:MFS family permease